MARIEVEENLKYDIRIFFFVFVKNNAKTSTETWKLGIKISFVYVNVHNNSVI